MKAGGVRYRAYQVCYNKSGQYLIFRVLVEISRRNYVVSKRTTICLVYLHGISTRTLALAVGFSATLYCRPLYATTAGEPDYMP